MSIIGLNIFNQTLKEKNVNNPAQALDYLNAQMYNRVNRNNKSVIRDGMDLAFCAIDKKSLKLTFNKKNLMATVGIVLNKHFDPGANDIDKYRQPLDRFRFSIATPSISFNFSDF